MSTFTKFLNGSGAYFSSDIVFLIVLFVIFFLCALYFGKNSIISVILAFYPAKLLYDFFPFKNSLLILRGDYLTFLNKFAIFLIFFIPLQILINRYVFHDSGYGSMHYLRMVGYALAMVILTLIISYSVVSLDIIHNFSSSIDVLFDGSSRIFFWYLAPLILLFVL